MIHEQYFCWVPACLHRFLYSSGAVVCQDFGNPSCEGKLVLVCDFADTRNFSGNGQWHDGRTVSGITAGGCLLDIRSIRETAGIRDEHPAGSYSMVGMLGNGTIYQYGALIRVLFHQKSGDEEAGQNIPVRNESGGLWVWG